MTAGDLSAAELHEQGLPPQQFALQHVEVPWPRRPGETEAAWRNRVFHGRVGRLQLLLMHGDVIAAGVSCGSGSVSADPRCIIHPAHWRAFRLQIVELFRGGVLWIDDRVAMPSGQEVIALRLAWASTEAAQRPSRPLLGESDKAPKEALAERIEAAVRASPNRRSLSKAEIKKMAYELGVIVQKTALTVREQVLAKLRREMGHDLAAWGTGGSRGTERGPSHAKLEAELKKLRPRKGTSNRPA